MNNKTKKITAEDFIREKVKSKYTINGDLDGLSLYMVNAEEALRYIHEFHQLKLKELAKDEISTYNIKIFLNNKPDLVPIEIKLLFSTGFVGNSYYIQFENQDTKERYCEYLDFDESEAKIQAYQILKGRFGLRVKVENLVFKWNEKSF